MSHLQITALTTEGRRVFGTIAALLTPPQGSARQASGPNPLAVAGLSTGPVIPYRCQVSAPGYCTVGKLIAVKNEMQFVALTLPIDARKVVGATFPDYTKLPNDVKLLLDGLDWLELGDEEKAGFLNITTKLRSEGLIQFVRALNIPKRDRLLVDVSPELWTLVSASPKFREVNGSLHHPPEGWQSQKSYKTGEKAGNLQITFFKRYEMWMADIDIDDAGGFAHTFQVVRNFVTRGTTHPYDIREILCAQGLRPGYSLTV